MTLAEILSNVEYQSDNINLSSNVTDVVYDSRKAGENIVFVCISGYQNDGHAFAQNAYDLGSRIFAVEKDIDVTTVTSNTFEMEWPPKSGKMQEFPENDRSEWFSIDEAKLKIFKGQVVFLTRLVEKICSK